VGGWSRSTSEVRCFGAGGSVGARPRGAMVGLLLPAGHAKHAPHPLEFDGGCRGVTGGGPGNLVVQSGDVSTDQIVSTRAMWRW